MLREKFFVGAYLALRPVEACITYRNRVCSSHAATHPIKSATAKFCMECGASIVERVATKNELISLTPLQLPDEFTDWMAMPESFCLSSKKGDVTIWLPNHHGYSLDIEDAATPVELTPAVIEDFLNRFQAHYQPLLDYLEAKYPGSLEVKFGALMYCS